MIKMNSKISKFIGDTIDDYCQSCGIDQYDFMVFNPSNSMYLSSKKAQEDQVLFRGGSLTKLYTAKIIMDFCKTKKINLDDCLDKYLPSFSSEISIEKITIRDLLYHTSGLPRELDVDYVSAKKIPTKEEFFNLLSETKPVFPSKTKYKYSNLAYYLLGTIVESVEGKPFKDVFHKHFWDISELNLLDLKNNRVVKGYSRILDENMDFENQLDLDTLSPAGQVYTNCEGFFNFFQKVLNDNYELLLEKSEFGDYSIFGKNFEIGNHKVVTHSGIIPGYGASYLYAPDLKIGLIIFGNREAFFFPLLSKILGSMILNSENYLYFDLLGKYKYLNTNFSIGYNFERQTLEIENSKIEGIADTTYFVEGGENTFKVTNGLYDGEQMHVCKKDGEVKGIKFGNLYYEKI